MGCFTPLPTTHQRPLGAVPCFSRVLLTRPLLMTSSHSQVRYFGLFQFALSRFMDSSAFSASHGCGVAAAISCFFFAANFFHVVTTDSYESWHGEKSMIFFWFVFNAVFGGWVLQAAGQKPQA